MDDRVCSAHSQQTATDTCARCGRFCCQACVSEREPILCRECFALVADPYGLRSTPLSIGASLRTGTRLLFGGRRSVLAFAVLFAIPAWALTSLLWGKSNGTTAAGVLTLYDATFGTLAQIAVIALLVAEAEGRRLTMGDAIGEALPRWGRGFWALFRQSLWIGALTLLLIVPGIWVFVTLLFAFVAVVRDEGDALDCSRALVANRWWSVAGWALCALAVSYGPTVVVSSFIGIGAHALHLEQPKWVLQVVNAFFTRVYSAAVMPALSVAAYYQLHVSSGRELPPMKWVTRARRRFERG